ncbi:hypothetical protein [Streptomyces sp. ISL-100]|uniref:hypothetical protein n=1 Tax=Streptomyces sp. ISL-100 TaxID=2819173 RepID=UPI001BE6B334|nr:hypothetical protein [Streptomyces sp. ISL-100]MBT2395195.1 hypothetical protein [Streptomyces sp. ISL-100]
MIEMGIVMPPPTPAQQEAQQKATEKRLKDEHDEKLEEHENGGRGYDRSKFKTNFMEEGIPELRRMILDSDPDSILEASLSWKQVHNILSGGDGDGARGGVDAVSAKDSVAGMMQSAVDNVMEHWEGDAARAFQRRAAQIGQDIRNGASHANLTATQLDAVQKDLRKAKEKMRDVKVPSGWDSFCNRMGDTGGRDTTLLDEDVKKGVDAKAAAKANEEMLSAGKEAQLQGVAVMEELAANYQVYSKNLRSGSVNDPKDPFKPPSNDVTMPPPITMPTPSGSGPGAAGAAPKPWSAGSTSKIGTAPQIPRAKGITGGAQLPPSTGTNVDSIKPGLTGPGLSPGPVSGGGGGGGGGSTGPGLIAPGGSQGGIRPAGGRGGISPVSGRGGRVGVPSGAGGTGRVGGRPGMGGMGGGAGAGAAGRAGAGAGGRGALAKARGGVVGAAKGIAGAGAGGGAGLHGSRGGTQRGGMPGGMAGGMGGRNGRRQGDENERGDRPDYLVEDEETWISEEDRNRNVPRNIE